MSIQQTLSRPTAAPKILLTGPPAHPSGQQSFLRFFCWLFLIPAIFYLSAIPLVRMPSYERWGPSHWGPMLDFAWKTQNLDADAVVFGDSSAFLGIDPRLIDHQLGIRSVVLPNTIGSLPVTGDQALEFYLAHNRRPRLIVLYFTAWDLDFAASTSTRLYEGEEMLLRHGNSAQIGAFVLQHPLEIPAFPLRNLSTVGPTILDTFVHNRDREAEAAAALGHVDDHEPYPPVEAACTLPPRFTGVNKAASVQALVQKYRSLGYDVVVYLAPVPACSNANFFAGQTFTGLAVAPPATLPPGSFKQDGFYAHLEPESVPTASRLFATAIKSYLQ